jgi:group I intron endonuclease
MSNLNIAYIYVLICPKTGEVRYVGKTVNPKSRYAGHLSWKGHTHVSRWIHSLINDGLKPILDIVDLCTKENWIERERYWIAYYRELGRDLTNLNGGGGGQFEASDETRTKIGLSLKGRPQSENARKKLSESTLGVKKSDSHRKSISEARKRASAEHNRKIGESLKKPINQYSLDGQFIRRWDGIQDVERAGIGSAKAIVQCLRGRAATSAGYIWKYALPKDMVES